MNFTLFIEHVKVLFVYPVSTMSLESAIEARIREAMERGEFDNLPGRGKPIDLDAYFNTPEDLRMAFSILKSNDFVPEEVEIMREIQTLKDRIKTTQNVAERETLIKTLHEKSLGLSLMIENRNRNRKR